MTPRAAQAVDEFATPRPRITAKPTLGTRATEIYVLRAPDLVGQPVAAARATLERGRLHAGRETLQLTNERPAGTVIGQDPKPGTALQPGASVNLWIATPPRVATVPAPALPPQRQDVIVPNLIGQTADTASAVLAKPGLSLGDRRRQDSEAPAGTVIAQSPVAGARVHPGTSVEVTIAVSALVAVPDLTGETPLQAARLLRRSQLGLGQERQRESQAPAGTVIRQAPAAGTRVPRETLVNVLIASAPAPVPPPTSSTTPVPPRPPIVIAPPIVVAPPVVIRPPVVIKPSRDRAAGDRRAADRDRAAGAARAADRDGSGAAARAAGCDGAAATAGAAGCDGAAAAASPVSRDGAARSRWRRWSRRRLRSPLRRRLRRRSVSRRPGRCRRRHQLWLLSRLRRRSRRRHPRRSPRLSRCVSPGPARWPSPSRGPSARWCFSAPAVPCTTACGRRRPAPSRYRRFRP